MTTTTATTATDLTELNALLAETEAAFADGFDAHLAFLANEEAEESGAADDCADEEVSSLDADIASSRAQVERYLARAKEVQKAGYWTRVEAASDLSNAVECMAYYTGETAEIRRLRRVADKYVPDTHWHV